MMPERLEVLLKRFEKLPDNAVVQTSVTAALLGVCEKTIRQHPKLARVYVSEGRFGFRKSDILELASGIIPQGTGA